MKGQGVALAALQRRFSAAAAEHHSVEVKGMPFGGVGFSGLGIGGAQPQSPIVRQLRTRSKEIPLLDLNVIGVATSFPRFRNDLKRDRVPAYGVGIGLVEHHHYRHRRVGAGRKSIRPKRRRSDPDDAMGARPQYSDVRYRIWSTIFLKRAVHSDLDFGPGAHLLRLRLR